MKAPTRVFLVRHALTRRTGAVLQGRAPGVHLSDDGRRQADGVAARLAPLPKIAAGYASPLQRARETPAAIARARGASLPIERGLTELDVRALTGPSLKRLSPEPRWRGPDNPPRPLPLLP